MKGSSITSVLDIYQKTVKNIKIYDESSNGSVCDHGHLLATNLRV